MARRNYKFTNKHHPVTAMASMILGSVSFLGVGAAVYLSFLAEGGTMPGYGLTGLLAVVFSLTGTILGICSFRENDCFRLFCWLGTLLNLIVLGMVGFLFTMGIRA